MQRRPSRPSVAGEGRRRTEIRQATAGTSADAPDTVRSMQPMARPGIKQYPEARSLSARPGFRALVLLDVLLHIGIVAWALLRVVQLGDTFGWIALGLAAAILPTSIGCLGLRPLSAIWRRRFGLLAVIAVLVRGNPFAQQPWVAVTVTVWTGIMWTALLIEGRRVAAAVVEATGEEGLGEDPSRHL